VSSFRYQFASDPSIVFADKSTTDEVFGFSLPVVVRGRMERGVWFLTVYRDSRCRCLVCNNLANLVSDTID
jgi:hypothetical protein